MTKEITTFSNKIIESIKSMEEYRKIYGVIHGEKVKRGLECARKKQLEKLAKLKNKTTNRIDVLAKLNEKERHVIFDNMGLDFEEENKKVIDYIKSLEKAVDMLFE